MAFTSCDESKDDHPVLGTHEGVIVENFLNIPEMTNTAVAITEENNGNHFHMTCSQPSYGFAVSAAYTVEISLSEDFTTPVVDGCPAYEALPTAFYDCSEINPSYSEVATAMSNILGITGKEQIPTAYHDVYVRLVSNVVGVGSTGEIPDTKYMSNVVKLTNASVQYLAIILPDLPSGIYLRGGMNDWGSPAEYEFLTTEEANVYAIASVTIAADVEFKVADANWAAINFGGTCGEVTTISANEAFELNTDPANGGPGNLKFDKNFTGRVTLTNKGATWTVLFESAEPDTPDQPTGIYLKGAMNDWSDLAAYEFVTTDFKNNYIVKNVTIGKDQEFKIATADWSTVNLGLNEGDTFEFGKAVKLIQGGGNMVCPDNFSGNIKLSLQGGAYVMTMEVL
ncbi:MAG: SusE domain-containing protein [Bacteroides sp.]|nr:SusE domain-containing protein [Bacteroides sp.]